MSPQHPPRVLVTRAAGQRSELADRLTSLGAEPVLIPAIEIADPSSFATLDAALSTLHTFHWLIFTSANAVESFGRRMQLHAATHPEPGQAPRIAVIGPSTARALEKLGLRHDLLPPEAVAESLTEALLPHTRTSEGHRTRFLLVRAEVAREHLPETLREAGAEVIIAPAYRTVTPQGSVEAIRDLFSGASSDPVAAVTFTSSSTARNLLELCDTAEVVLPDTALRISIGPITSQTMRELQIPPHAESAEATVAALAETVIATIATQRGTP